MADEKRESRIKVADLPQPERELTAAEQKQIRGGKDKLTDTLKELFDTIGRIIQSLTGKK